MATDTGFKYLRRGNQYEAVPNVGDVPFGAQEVNYQDFVSGARQQGISALQGYKQGQIEAPGVGQANRLAATKAFEQYGGQSTLDILSGIQGGGTLTPEQITALERSTGLGKNYPGVFNQATPSGITMLSGVPTEISKIDPTTGKVPINESFKGPTLASQTQPLTTASSVMSANSSVMSAKPPENQVNIGTAEAPMYVPLESPGLQNYLQNVVPNIQKGILSPSGTPSVPDINAQYKQALTQTQASGIPPSPDGGTARQIVQNNLPPAPQTNPVLDNLFAEDKNLTNFSKQIQDFLSPQNQQTTLRQEYETLAKTKGIEGMNTELMNMKNVIEGTEDDIRTEITKAGGFATESQVQALTIGRNKTLIKNYNNLLQTKQQAEQYINTLMGLEQADRQAASQKLDKQLNLSFQLMDYQQKMQTNARNTIQKIVDTVGYDGIAKMTQGNPYYTSLVEKTLGLGTGGLNQLATYKKPLTEEEQLNLDVKKAQLENLKEKDLQFVSGTENQPSGYFDKTTGKFTPLGKGKGGGGSTAIINTIKNDPLKSNEQKNTAILDELLKTSKISAGTKTNLANTLGVVNALQDLATLRQTTGFKGISPLNAVLDVQIPFTDINVIPFRESLKSKEAVENRQYLEAINLKVQQWASGASLTKQQTDQVNQFTPRPTDTDEKVRTKINGLANFMMTQVATQLQTEGVNFKPDKVNLFEMYDLLQKASPEQKAALKAQGLIQ